MSRTKVQLIGDAQGGANFTGVVTATSFSGDGSSLTGITAGATLDSSSGSQRVVLTGLTSGTMTSAATNAGLIWNSTTNTLSATNVSIAGTLTYEDVTNVDSIGLVTARSGVQVTGGNLLVGTSSSTGTSSQPLQVTGGAYVSGNLGVGTTNPTQKLHLEGALYVNNPNSSGLVFSPSTLGAQYYPTESGSTSTARYWIRFDSTNNASYPFLTNRTPNGDFAICSGTTAGGGEIERLRFKGGDSTQSVYFSNCNVGIGLTNPSSQVHITGQFQSTQANSTTTGGGQIYLNGATGNRIDFNQNGVAAPAFTTRSAGTKIVLFPEIGASSVDYALGIENNTLWFSVPQTTSRQFRWYAGTTNVGTLTGDGNLTVSGNVSGYSDIRLKDNIQTIPNALDKVSKLRGVEFDRNDIEENPHQIGVIAQEVEEIIPEVVHTNTDGIKSVAYGNLVGLLIEAIKDLKEEVNELKAKLEEK